MESDNELPDIDEKSSPVANKRREGTCSTDFATPTSLSFRTNAEQVWNLSRKTTPSSSHRMPGQSVPSRGLTYENNSIHSTALVQESALVSISSNLEQIN